MIYLIGGSPRCGKTILAKKISLKKKISLVSTDAFRPMVLEMTPKSEIKKKFPQTDMPTPKNKFRFDIYSSKEMLKAQAVEAKTMWPPTKAFIRSLIYREQDFVIEGVHLFPSLVNELKKTAHWKHIRVVYLIKTDIEKIIAGFSRNKDSFDWMYPSIKDNGDRLTKAAEMVREKSLYIEKGCKKHRFKAFNTEAGFNKKIREALNYLI
jgi:2-phosphoglycerate kinase